MTKFSKLKVSHVAVDVSLANGPCLGKSGTPRAFRGDLGVVVKGIWPLQAGDLASCCVPLGSCLASYPGFLTSRWYEGLDDHFPAMCTSGKAAATV